MTPKAKSLFLILVTASVVLIGYLPNLHGPFFMVDDSALIDIPQLQLPFSIRLFQTILTPGYHVDFYPLRDLSYWFDIHVLSGKRGITDPFIFRIHNLILFLFIGISLYHFLKKILEDKTIALGMTCLWMVNPVHYELVWWASSRKDLLAILFFVWSALEWLRYQESDRTLHSTTSLLLFICSSLCKTSFLLVPLALLFLSLRGVPFRSRSLPILIAACAFSLSWGALQQWQYTQVNDMRFFYSMAHRISSALAGLGRECLSALYWGWGAVDLFNWGEWFQLNSHFAIPGALFFLLFFILWWTKRIERSTWFVGLMTLATYLPTSGLLFPHRNFYSQRYFEAPLLVLWVGLSLWLSSKKAKRNKRFWVLLGTVCFAYYSFGLMNESEKWDSNRTILEKSLSVTPSNPALQTAYLVELLNLKSRQQLEDHELSKPDDINFKLQKKCYEMLNQDPKENGTLCSVFLRHSLDLMEKDKKSRDMALWSKLNQWLLKFESMRTRRSMQDISNRNWVKRVLVAEERSPAPSPQPGYFAKEEQRRGWILANQLIDDSPANINQLRLKWVQQGLLNPGFHPSKSTYSEK